MKPTTLTTGIISLLPTLSHAARSCTPEANSTPIKWTISEFTYDSADKSFPAGSRTATDAVVGLYLTDYSCYGAFNESWGGRADPESYSVDAPLIWFPCVNSRGRAVDETVSFAIDWLSKELHVAHMYTCSDGDKKGQTTTASTTIPLSISCTTGEDSTRCITTDRFFDVYTTPDNLGSLSSPGCTAQSIGPLPSWQITSYTQLYYAFRNPAPTKPPGVGSGSDINLFSVRYMTSTSSEPIPGEYNCSLPHSIPRPPASSYPSQLLRRQSGATGRIVRGVCTPASGSGSLDMSWSFDPLYKTLTVTHIPGCAGRTLTLRGAGVLPDSACRASGDEGCASLDPFWIGGSIIE
ncbi:hypothetical protein V8F06_005206 [Rhypophila decipiens]